uniref:Uncharacterized protein n=1 Tax=Anguilla anguilla TaxID=7936 RepID=A0A0E9U0K9_ANGAN
MELFSEQCF